MKTVIKQVAVRRSFLGEPDDVKKGFDIRAPPAIHEILIGGGAEKLRGSAKKDSKIMSRKKSTSLA